VVGEVVSVKLWRRRPGNMFQFKRDFEEDLCGARNLDFSRSLNPALQTFDQWLAQNTSRIPLEQNAA